VAQTWCVRFPNYTTQSAPPSQGAGINFTKADDPRVGHNLHGRPVRHQTDGFGGAWPWPEVRTPDKEALGRTSLARSGGVRRTLELPVTTRLTSGQTPAGWSGSVTWIGWKHMQCRSQVSRAPQARIRGGVGEGMAMGGRPDLGEKVRDAEKPEAGRRWWLGVLRGSRRGSTG